MLDAFFASVLTAPYETISVDLIARRADVSRSTFYAHFAGKNALLAASLRTVFEPLADTLAGPDDATALTAVLSHFWDNRALARSLFSGTMRAHAVQVLAVIVQNRLPRGTLLVLPRRLAARQLADSLLSPVIAWLLGEAHCSPGRLAGALHQSGIALLRALRI